MMHSSTLRTVRLLATFALLLAQGACGNLVAGGATGEAAVILSGDAADVVPMTSLADVPTAMGTSSAAEGSQPEGEIEVEFNLFLEASDGDLISLTQQEVRVRVDLEGVREEEVASQVLPVGRYSGLRIVFIEIEVEVDAGLVIDGVEVTGSIDVELENAIAVTRSLDLDIGADEQVVLLVDLNAASWLQAVDPVTRTVDVQVFADLVTVTVR